MTKGIPVKNRLIRIENGVIGPVPPRPVALPEKTAGRLPESAPCLSGCGRDVGTEVGRTAVVR
jgi:hypothetical protein